MKHSQIGKDDNGTYTCFHCGNQWSDKPIWLWWPIQVKFIPRRRNLGGWRIGKWGIEVGAYHFGQRVLMRVVQIGQFRIIFGDENYRAKADTPFKRVLRWQMLSETQDYLTELEQR